MGTGARDSAHARRRHGRRRLGQLTALVDTSVLVGSALLADRDFDEDWAISAVTVGELQAGVLLATRRSVRAARLRRLSAILAAAPVISIDQAVATSYGELRAASGRHPTNDLWIAATALAHDLTLLTADRRQAGLPLVRVAVVG